MMQPNPRSTPCGTMTRPGCAGMGCVMGCVSWDVSWVGVCRGMTARPECGMTVVIIALCAAGGEHLAGRGVGTLPLLRRLPLGAKCEYNRAGPTRATWPSVLAANPYIRGLNSARDLGQLGAIVVATGWLPRAGGRGAGQDMVGLAVGGGNESFLPSCIFHW